VNRVIQGLIVIKKFALKIVVDMEPVAMEIAFVMINLKVLTVQIKPV
jgi:hypothetical protein